MESKLKLEEWLYILASIALIINVGIRFEYYIAVLYLMTIDPFIVFNAWMEN